MKYNNQGFIAITTAIFFGIVIVLLALSSALISSLTRTGALDASLKAQTDFLARTCLEHALLKLAQDPSYAGNETITVGQDNCSVASIVSSPLNKIITTSSTVLNSSTTFQTTVNDQTLETVVFQEL